jgi:FkbM family methyltransferase
MLDINNILRKNPLIIIDIGASGGLDPMWAQFTSSYKGILFEPDPREYVHLKKNNSGNDNLIILNAALSDSNKMVDFHLCKKQMVSSVFEPNFDFLNKFDDAERFEVEKTIKLNTDTLDSQLNKANVTEVDFIKLDVQGYELPILKGAVDSLSSTIGIKIEVEFAEMYKGQPLFEEVNTFITGKGFDLIDLQRHYWKRKGSSGTGTQKGQLVYADALYFKSPEYILGMKNLSQEIIIRSIFVYLAYGYYDLAQVLLSEGNSKSKLDNDTLIKLTSILKKFKKKDYIPHFKGRYRLKVFCEKLAKRLDFGHKYSGYDTSIGNSD